MKPNEALEILSTLAKASDMPKGMNVNDGIQYISQIGQAERCLGQLIDESEKAKEEAREEGKSKEELEKAIAENEEA
jgi:hypothetical protein